MQKTGLSPSSCFWHPGRWSQMHTLLQKPFNLISDMPSVRGKETYGQLTGGTKRTETQRYFSQRSVLPFLLAWASQADSPAFLPVSAESSQCEDRDTYRGELDGRDELAAHLPKEPLLREVAGGIHWHTGHQQEQVTSSQAGDEDVGHTSHSTVGDEDLHKGDVSQQAHSDDEQVKRRDHTADSEHGHAPCRREQGCVWHQLDASIAPEGQCCELRQQLCLHPRPLGRLEGSSVKCSGRH